MPPPTRRSPRGPPTLFGEAAQASREGSGRCPAHALHVKGLAPCVGDDAPVGAVITVELVLCDYDGAAARAAAYGPAAPPAEEACARAARVVTVTSGCAPGQFYCAAADVCSDVPCVLAPLAVDAHPLQARSAPQPAPARIPPQFAHRASCSIR